KAAEFGIDGALQFAADVGFAAATGGDHFPEQVVVEPATTVVLNSGTNIFGHAAEIAYKFFDRFACQFGVFLNRGVEVVGVGRMVLAVMNFHRLSVDMWFERVVGISQFRQLNSHV